jgi:hypothetical protein
MLYYRKLLAITLHCNLSGGKVHCLDAYLVIQPGFFAPAFVKSFVDQRLNGVPLWRGDAR